MLWRVIQALEQCESIDQIIIVGPTRDILDAYPQLNTDLQRHGVIWVAPANSPSASAAKALQLIAPDKPALITTADHALLQPAMVDTLLKGAREQDFALAMVAHDRVMRAYPNTQRTAIRLRPGPGYCGCNLFAVNSASGRRLIELWQSVESQRKHPAKLVIGMLGWAAVLRYLLGRLTLDDAFSRLSRALDMSIAPVLLEDPTAAIDVDSVADLELVQTILAQRKADI